MNPTLTRALGIALIDPSDPAALSALARELRRLGFMGESAQASVADQLLEDVCSAYGLSQVERSVGADGVVRWSLSAKSGASSTARQTRDAQWKSDAYTNKSSLLAALCGCAEQVAASVEPRIVQLDYACPRHIRPPHIGIQHDDGSVECARCWHEQQGGAAGR